MVDLDNIKTIVIVMMENRSFDHMLGYLSLAPFARGDVDGQKIDPAWLSQFTNYDKAQANQPFHCTNPYWLPPEFDPPHERDNIAAQIDPRQDNSYPMNGFVGAIPPKVSDDPNVRKLVMGYFGAYEVPISHFFAQNFTICDRWFSALPAGTQPNRLMAMGGASMIALNQSPLPNQDLVYDWLNQRKVTWRVYHQGIPFFAMMPKWLAPVLFGDNFRKFEDLAGDLQNTPPDDLPDVIFVEPTYGDAPRWGRSTDDHAPAGVSDGQEFLMQVYNAVIANVDFWKSTLMVIDYDEHGGFFDHVRPPAIPTHPPDGARWSIPFETLGVRTPAYIVSPFVARGGVSHNLLDHTSLLKLLGEKYGGGSYSSDVDARAVGSLSHVLDFTNPQYDTPAPPPVNEYLAKRPPAPQVVVRPPRDTALQQGFADVVENMKQHGADSTHPKFGPLLQ